ncbi:MAG: cyclic nucleotide-binding domain-containing protein [Myxococcales bacterium]|nr:cyclic nucleotide-binding domain-containing protein [Myxococcales bacterium]
MSAPDPRLRSHPAFKSLDDAELQILSSVLRPSDYAAGATICREGDPGRSCYFVTSGEVDVLKAIDGQSERVLFTLRAGDVFGQVSLIDPGSRSATCRAKKPVTAFQLDRQDFDMLFNSGSRFALRFQLALARVAVGQLREANRRLNLLLASAKPRSSETERHRALREVQDILARTDSQASDAIRWID